MRLAELGEFGFIERIAKLVGAPQAPVEVGIGDDAAVLKLAAAEYLLVTTDVLVEDVHFRRQWLTAGQIGARVACAGLSDIAAMGGEPVAAFVSAAWPPTLEVAAAEDLMVGLAEVVGQYGAVLAGGDTTASPQGIFIDVIILGTTPQPWLRSGAQPGDILMVTGSLGEAAAALALLQAGHVTDASALPQALARRFASPTPRLAVVKALAARNAVKAAIDISDGLVQDAGHLSERSRVAVILESARVPISPICRQTAQQLGQDPVQWALTSGEEYELLLAVSPDLAEQAAELVAEQAGTILTQIGSITEGEGVTVLDESGKPMEVTSSGWDHFRPDPPLHSNTRQQQT